MGNIYGNRTVGRARRSGLGLIFYLGPSPPPMSYLHSDHFAVPYTNPTLVFSLSRLSFLLPGMFICSSPALSYFCDLSLCANTSWRRSHPLFERAPPPHRLSQGSVQFSFETHHSGLFLLVCWLVSVAPLLNRTSSVRLAVEPAFFSPVYPAPSIGSGRYQVSDRYLQNY